MIPHSKPSLSEEEIEAAVAVLKSGNIAVGPEIEAFEAAIAAFVGKKYAVAVNNGTSALHLSLLALEVKDGDEVIIPAGVCPALLHAIEYTGALPIMCDVNEGDLNLNFDAATKAINKNTKAIILPHMFGVPSDLDAFLNLGIPIVEDCAQAIGSEYRGEKLGSFGIVSTYSFYATKIMTSVDGGMILTDDKALADFMRDVRYYGGRRHYRTRYNYKLQNLNAAIGLEQLKKLSSFMDERAKLFSMLKAGFLASEACEILGENDSNDAVVCYKMLIKFSCDDAKSKYLQLCDDLEINTCSPIFVDLKAFREQDSETRLPNLREHMRNTYSFPIYPGIEKDVIDQFIKRLPDILPKEAA